MLQSNDDVVFSVSEMGFLCNEVVAGEVEGEYLSIPPLSDQVILRGKGVGPLFHENFWHCL